MDEIINQLIDDFEEVKETEIRASDEDVLRDEALEELEEELDDTPTNDQVEERLQEKIDELVCGKHWMSMHLMNWIPIWKMP